MTADKQMQFLTTPDNIQLWLTSWLVEQPRAAVLLVHGIGEHIGRYGHVIAALTGRGYSVFAYDQRGHGKSGGQRVYFETAETLPNDLAVVREEIENDAYGLPVFLYGHSMGTLVSLNYAIDHQDRVAGLILTGAALTADTTVPAPLRALSQVANRVLPGLRVLAPVDARLLSHDPAVIKAYNEDPLINHKAVSVRTGTSLQAMLVNARERLAQLKLPLLVLHGDADRICPPSGSQTLYDQAGSEDKTLTLYPGLLHEIHNEFEKHDILAAIVDWLDAHTEPRPTGGD